MVDTIIALVQSAGYPGIVVLMFVETLFPPIPSELILPFAGFTAAEGDMSIVWVIVAGTIGTMLGALTVYGVSRLLHEEAIESWIGRHGKYIGVTQKDFTSAQKWFDKNGYLAVFLCRLLPGIRSLISIPAGVRRMKFGRFFIISLIGTTIWNVILAVGGYVLGSNYHILESAFDSFGKVVYFVCALAVVGLLVYRLIIIPRRSK